MTDTPDTFEPWVRLARLTLAHLPRRGDYAAVYAFRHMTMRQMLRFGGTSPH